MSSCSSNNSTKFFTSLEFALNATGTVCKMCSTYLLDYLSAELTELRIKHHHLFCIRSTRALLVAPQMGFVRQADTKGLALFVHNFVGRADTKGLALFVHECLECCA